MRRAPHAGCGRASRRSPPQQAARGATRLEDLAQQAGDLVAARAELLGQLGMAARFERREREELRQARVRAVQRRVRLDQRAQLLERLA